MDSPGRGSLEGSGVFLRGSPVGSFSSMGMPSVGMSSIGVPSVGMSSMGSVFSRTHSEGEWTHREGVCGQRTVHCALE